MTRRQSLALLGAPALASAAAPPAKAWPVCMFSKHFQWTGIAEMTAMCKEIGFDGIDLTLRPGGHIEPAQVDEELPRALATIHAAGLATPMVTSGILDATTPHTEKVLAALKKAGITRYRWGTFKYDPKRPLIPQLNEWKPKLKDLAAMNKQYGMCAMYHTHSGVNYIGASMWDLYDLLKDHNPDQLSVNLDAGHATAEGGYGAWIHTVRLLGGMTRGIALKDFLWEKDAKGWHPGWCGFGKGMVNFKQFLTMIKAAGFQGPVQLHFEYPELGGIDAGKKELTIPKERVAAIFKRDLDACRAVLREVGMA